VVGSVTGQPLSKVELRLEPVDRQSASVAITTSDANGHFAMTDLDPGRYHLKAKRRGYLEMSYGARRADADGTVLQLETGQTAQDLTFKLIPAAVIAGTVRDSDGEPIEDAHVSLDRLTYRHGQPRVEAEDSADTDDRGEYRFPGLSPAKYYIGVEPRSYGWDRVDRSANTGPAETSIPTFYSGAPHLAAAAPIAVSEGEHVEGIDVTLLRSHVFRVAGRVVNAPPAERSTVILNDPKDADRSDYPMRTATKNAAGDFEFRGVPPGAYQVTVAAASQQGIAPVVVGASDVEGVRVTLAPGAEVKGRVTVEGAGKPQLAGMSLLFTVAGRNNGQLIPVVEDDALTANLNGHLMPDHYQAKVIGRSLSGLYVKSIRSGETDVLADGLTVMGGGAIDIEIVLASDGAAVEGVALDKNQQPLPGATILLAPARRSRMDLYHSATADQNGRYEFTAVAPGDYKLFAWDDVEPGAWNDPDFLKDYEKQGEKTTLDPKSRATVTLHIATTSDAQ
jgi:hypothetical protein